MKNEHAKYTSSHWGTYRITDDGLVPVAEDTDPAPAGRGWFSAACDANTRVARPSFRAGWLKERDRNRRGDAEFVELPWDEALDIVAEELKRVIADHGNTAIYGGSYGWSSAGRFHHAQSQLKRFLNCIGGCTSSRNTYSHAGGEVLWPHILGLSNRDLMHELTSWDRIADNCQLLVAFGGISPRTAQISAGGTSTHETRGWLNRIRSGSCRMINVSPVASDLEGAEWLSIKPGTDRALILALSHVILSEGLEDREFLDRCTVGADRFADSVLGRIDGVAKTPEWAETICGIGGEGIRALARALAERRSMITMTWSLQRQDHGEETIWAGLNLACLIGQIGQPGCGFGYGYGSMNTSGRPVGLWNWPSFPQGRNPVSTFIPVARVTDMLEKPGQSFRYNGGTFEYPDIRLVWWAGGNPFHHHQDLNRLARAWQVPETVIVNEHSWTATARRADIVLPATSPLERDDFMMMRRDPVLVYMSKAREPFGAARNEYDFFQDLAVRMGVGDDHGENRNTEDWLRHIWRQARDFGRERGIELPDFDTFRQQGRFEIPDAARSKDLLSDFVSNPDAYPLQTPSGLIEMASSAIGAMNLDDIADTPGWSEPSEILENGDKDQLHLISPQPESRLHAQNDPGAETRATKVNGREPCRLHPETARRFDLGAGDIAELHNDRGSCLTAVIEDDGIRPDCVVLPTGAWLDSVEIDGRQIDVHGNPNVLTLDKGSSQLSQGNSAHTALVRIRKWRGNAPPVAVFDGPRIVSR